MYWTSLALSAIEWHSISGWPLLIIDIQSNQLRLINQFCCFEFDQEFTIRAIIILAVERTHSLGIARYLVFNVMYIEVPFENRQLNIRLFNHIQNKNWFISEAFPLWFDKYSKTTSTYCPRIFCFKFDSHHHGCRRKYCDHFCYYK